MSDKTKPALILASQSPRRKELLTQLGYQFTTESADIDESLRVDESPEDYVIRLAIEKAQVVAMNQPMSIKALPCVVLGSDTSVVFEHHVLGKPKDIDECCQQLLMLSQQKHQVLTAIAIVQGQRICSKLVITEVFFKTLSLAEIKRYWQTGEPQDKAGSYGIQGFAGQFVKKIIGSYSAVVGLPLYETAQMLAEFNLPTPIQGSK